MQTNAVLPGGGISAQFNDASGVITLPPDFAAARTNYLHVGGGTNPNAAFYRVKLLP